MQDLTTELVFESTPEGESAAIALSWEHFHGVKQQRVRMSLYVGVAIGFFSLVFGVGRFDDPYVPGLVFATGSMIATYLYLGMSYRVRLEKTVETVRAARESHTVTLRIDPAAAYTHVDTISVSIPWARVSEVLVRDDRLFVVGPGGTIISVSTNEFGDPSAFEAFVDRVKALADAPPAAFRLDRYAGRGRVSGDEVTEPDASATSAFAPRRVTVDRATVEVDRDDHRVGRLEIVATDEEGRTSTFRFSDAAPRAGGPFDVGIRAGDAIRIEDVTVPGEGEPLIAISTEAVPDARASEPRAALWARGVEVDDPPA